ncbi:hypothetical protein NQ166_12505 [Microbacterium sp. zg.Y1090]|uniref:hypothetical protein n=1 Tax=Microbacterium TaxID=33882 RepID=UPI00214C8D92|nr:MULTISPECIES: hypothetical protein [unclassified Microbacterium]MCR2813840.1 hypothetical protein [Microbacterium sp. zg.Y1084]MCR2819646.1 hypothetical protein [Microbacterium sp. zg.Y1090]MDL5487494.1 hypothetical protein [Microbacterium sp. zg-Y1211]WIM28109.1 hypothetical protein QNO26_13325 [Microbacterium sp. zg-Y1090]
MKIELRGVSKGRNGEALPQTDLSFETGQAVFARAETEQRPTVLGLLASGRMKPDEGTIEIDGMADAAGMRRRIALVDAPDISEPAPRVTVGAVTAEELMFAGVSSGRRTVHRWLSHHHLDHLMRRPIATVAPRARMHLLTELAVLRADVEALVVVAPDRHGGDPRIWWDQALALADRGFGMLMIAGYSSAKVIGAITDDTDREAGDPGEPAVEDARS